MWHARRSIEKIGYELRVLGQINSAKAGTSAMLMHVDVIDRDVFGAVVVSKRQRLAYGGRSHRCTEAPVIDIITVGNRVVAASENNQSTIIKPTCAAGNEPDPFGSKEVVPAEVISNPPEQRGGCTEDRRHP